MSGSSAAVVENPDEEESSASSEDVEWEQIDFDTLRRDTEALAAWLNALLSGEVARLSEHDVRALPLATKSVVTSVGADGEFTHTVTLATGLDFNTVESIFLGPVRPCELKTGFSALTLMLWTAKGMDVGMPMVCAVLLPNTATQDDSRMRVWRFTNDKDESVTHRIGTIEEIR
jgi:hypothetical protein